MSGPYREPGGKALDVEASRPSQTQPISASIIAFSSALVMRGHNVTRITVPFVTYLALLDEVVRGSLPNEPSRQPPHEIALAAPGGGIVVSFAPPAERRWHGKVAVRAVSQHERAERANVEIDVDDVRVRLPSESAVDIAHEMLRVAETADAKSLLAGAPKSLRARIFDAAASMAVPVEWVLRACIELSLRSDDERINELVGAVESVRDAQARERTGWAGLVGAPRSSR